ncbi:MAG: 50S ribosomal protein L5 [Rickettsia sp.]|nr:50S ribosomal protein L5 [Rickettsia sp.]
MLVNFKSLYSSSIKEDLLKELRYKNLHQIPFLKKITINMGIGNEVIANSKAIDSVMRDLALISGQKPAYSVAKKSVSNFKLRKGMRVGCKVTLRKNRMYDFLERLVMTALPRVRDFRGFSKKSFDGNGNFSFGIKEYIVFPEIDYDKVDKVRGMDITISTSASNDLDAKLLLSKFFFPFLD